ncbi:TIGR03089 family protein [Corynebacterium sp. CCM 9185]|uniref:TIGR03089 family protein n=1 Tax=Corynebacterium marambiense TaxID=2765364 RepID=A0ABS0VY57_9CORY|nr:TIGR03089 family protein [Corynebacterium marambiense]MBI9001674.1 TIGR03089 family protein [Corynebacterium marambiense]MCK7662139.1 TIGR03089 family protein [Corynebacterium marambiense]
MDLLRDLLTADPGVPRLTVYNETTGARLDFSAQTLDNWASKVGNMLYEEFDLQPGSRIAVNLPAGWQAVAVVLGALAAGIDYTIGADPSAEVLFTSPDRVDASFTGDIAVVTDDPFGRGVEECGGTVPDGVVDFGPVVRFYGDQFPYPTKTLHQLVGDDAGLPPAGARTLITGWTDGAGFTSGVLAPLAAGGSVVVVNGPVDSTRLEAIATTERVTHR